MNAVEIEEAVSDLASRPFDAAEFPFQFLAAFGNKETTLKRLRTGSSNTSDLPCGVLQRNNIHIAVAAPGEVGPTLFALRMSPKTASAKAKLTIATDGATLEAEDLLSGETIACDYSALPRHFGFFLPLAGISTVKEIKNNPIDIKATGRLNKLYVELLKENPEWATEERRPALNQFMARLIFCFFAEDTGIFLPQQFTRTITQMSDSQSANTHEVLAELFRAMDIRANERRAHNLPAWADAFPYVNGGLFTNVAECPRFSRIARSYLLRAGELDWKEINPDIFGSMIQAVAEDGERGELGMHYTSVPNILKVLNPLFLDGLREQLDAAGDNARKLRNLRKRLSTIRVFDPACGSGNFLVIAYKEMRAIEADILRRLGAEQKRTVMTLSSFYGIELKGFAAEIARLALLIAEFQADCLYLSQQEARSMVLPLHKTGQISVGNALDLEWLTVCPPVAKVLTEEYDLGGPTGRLALEDNGLGDGVEPETYICGNPPYLGSLNRSVQQQGDMDHVFAAYTKSYKDLDYVAAWFFKAAQFCESENASCAFVATNSICQGEQVHMLWSLVFARALKITFAHRSFHWTNLASSNAGVTCVIVGIARSPKALRLLYEGDQVRSVDNIGPYLLAMPDLIVRKSPKPLDGLPAMDYGNKPTDNGNLILDRDDVVQLLRSAPSARRFLKKYQGSHEFIHSWFRYCLWLDDTNIAEAREIPEIADRLAAVRAFREMSDGTQANANASTPHRFVYAPHQAGLAIIVPRHSSANRYYLPAGLVSDDTVISDAAAAIYGGPVWALSIIVSRMHQQWIATVCSRIRKDYRYSSTLGWHTFPLPNLTEQNKADLTRCAHAILLAREAHFPATIAELYDPESMPEELRRAHEANDEALERIYIGRRFRNDTERLEKLFELYTRMTAGGAHTTTKVRMPQTRTA